MKTWVPFVGSLGAALLAHVPCCGTAALLAIGGASVSTGFLAQLAPYKDALTALSLGILALGFVLAYRTPKACDATCAAHHAHLPQVGDSTPKGSDKRLARIAAVWVAALLTAAVYAAPAVGLVPRHTHTHAHALTHTQSQTQSNPAKTCTDPDCTESH